MGTLRTIEACGCKHIIEPMKEIKCEQVATLQGGKWDKMHDTAKHVYGTDGIASTLHTCGGGNLEPKIAEPLAYDEQNQYVRRDGTVGTLTTDGSSPKHNNRVVEPQEIQVYDGFNQQVRADQSTVGALTRNVGADLKRNGQGIVELYWVEDCGFSICPKCNNEFEYETKYCPNCGTRLFSKQELTEYELSDKMKKYINSYDDKYKVSDGNLVVNKVVAGAVTTREGNTRADASSYISNDLPENTNIAGKDMTRFRVRKLTERECFKLMGVKVEDYEKVRQNQSKSSCYHLAGDSIMTPCLMALFGQMLGVDWNKKVNDLVQELIK